VLPQNLQLQQDALFIAGKKFMLRRFQKIYLLCAGKAASAMAFEAEKILGKKIYQGLVITKYHHAMPLQFCETIEAAHPVPDENSVKAAKAIEKFIAKNY